MLTTAFRDQILNTLDAVALSAWSPFLGLIKSITDFRAGTIVEADYTGYGTRPAISFGAPGVTSPAGGRQKANDLLCAEPQNTGANQDVIAWGLWTAATAGQLNVIGPLDDDPAIVGTANLTGDLITTEAVHGLVTDQRVFVMAAPGILLPAGLSENVAYFVLAAGLTTTAFALSTSSGGAAVNITAGGAAMFIPYKAKTVATSATPEFAIGAIVWAL